MFNDDFLLTIRPGRIYAHIDFDNSFSWHGITKVILPNPHRTVTCKNEGEAWWLVAREQPKAFELLHEGNLEYAAVYQRGRLFLDKGEAHVNELISELRARINTFHDFVCRELRIDVKSNGKPLLSQVTRNLAPWVRRTQVEWRAKKRFLRFYALPSPFKNGQWELRLTLSPIDVHEAMEFEPQVNEAFVALQNALGIQLSQVGMGAFTL